MLTVTLIVGLVSVLHAEIVVLEVDVAVGEDHSLTDFLPDDARHLISVHFDDRLCHLRNKKPSKSNPQESNGLTLTDSHLDAAGACGRGSQASLGDLREHSE